MRTIRRIKAMLLSLFRPEESEQIIKAREGMGAYDLGFDHKAEW